MSHSVSRNFDGLSRFADRVDEVREKNRRSVDGIGRSKIEVSSEVLFSADELIERTVTQGFFGEQNDLHCFHGSCTKYAAGGEK